MTPEVAVRDQQAGRATGAGRVLRWLVAATQAASRVLALLAALIVFVMLAINVVDIVLRSLFDAPLSGLYEYTEVALVALVFLGVPYTMQVGGHVAIESLTIRLPGRLRRWVETAALVVVLPFVIWLVVASVDVAIQSFTTGEVKFGVVEVPLWPARALIAVGAALLAAEIAIAIGQTARRTVPRDESTTAEVI